MHSYEIWARMWGWKCDDCPSVNGKTIGSKRPLNFYKAKRSANHHIRDKHTDNGVKAEDLIYKLNGGN